MYAFQYLALYQKPSESNVSNSQGRNLGHSVIPARTAGLSSTEGLAQREWLGRKQLSLQPVLLTQMITQATDF